MQCIACLVIYIEGVEVVVGSEAQNALYIMKYLRKGRGRETERGTSSLVDVAGLIEVYIRE